MAKEIITSCDASFTVRSMKVCGESHDDTRTCRIAVNGETWEIDLGGPHLEALMSIAHMGRKGASSIGTGRPQDQRSLNRRIRGIPES